MFVKPSSAFVGKPSRRRELLGQREEGAVGEVVAVDEEELGVARGRVVELELRPRSASSATLRSMLSPPSPTAVTRVPLLSGSRIARRRRPRRRRRAAAAAARRRDRRRRRGGARGAPLPARRRAARAARHAAAAAATVVVEPPTLPIPVGVARTRATRRSPRPSTSSSGSASRRVTILVAGGLVPAARRRTRSGCSSRPSSGAASAAGVIVHDAEADDLVELGTAGPVPLRVSPRSSRPISS